MPTDNRYILHEQLGRGGMGTVYRAFDRLTETFVALKQLDVDPSSIDTDPGPLTPYSKHIMLVHEFRLLASLRHPNIISVLDYGFFSDRMPFFVMELVQAPQTILDFAESQDIVSK